MGFLWGKAPDDYDPCKEDYENRELDRAAEAAKDAEIAAAFTEPISDAEKDAALQYQLDQITEENGALPKEIPDWAEDLPNASEFAGEDHSEEE